MAENTGFFAPEMGSLEWNLREQATLTQGEVAQRMGEMRQ